jgi:hypothetical protein
MAQLSSFRRDGFTNMYLLCPTAPCATTASASGALNNQTSTINPYLSAHNPQPLICNSEHYAPTYRRRMVLGIGLGAWGIGPAAGSSIPMPCLPDGRRAPLEGCRACYTDVAPARQI